MYAPLTKAANTTFERPRDYGDGREIRAIGLAKKNALDHAYLTDLAGLMGANAKEYILDFGNWNKQDLQNNAVAKEFLEDLEEREPMLDIYQRMKRAAENIRDRERMRNPQYPWAYYKNRGDDDYYDN